MSTIHKRDFITSPYRSERDRLIIIEKWNVKKFFELLDKLKDFFEYDKCYVLADNYLVAMTFTYFLRASLEPDEYTTDNFFAALYLAYNMEEDDDDVMLLELTPWLSKCDQRLLLKLRDEMFRRIEYRGAVSRTCCDVVMRSANPDHRVWKRRRHIYHSGVHDYKFWVDGETEICPTCKDDIEEKSECAWRGW